MSITLNISKGGIKAHQKAMSNIANNIANVNSEGYKTKATHFTSLLNNESVTENGNFTVNAGARSDVLGTDFSQGPLIENPSTLQLALEGEGFFQVQDGNGNTYLTRDGSFSKDGTGQIVNQSGDYLMINPSVPMESWPGGRLSVTNNGELFVGTEQVGTVPVYLPENPQGLIAVGENKYQYMGDNLPLYEGEILQNYSETSNVDLAQEMANMIITQRAYSLNVKVAQSTDEMMSLINQFNQ